MLNENFVYASVLISFFGSFSYIADTFKGKIKPNRVTWFLWGLLPLVTFLGQLSEGVGIQALLTLVLAVEPFAILLGSYINKKSYWEITTLDKICFLLCILGVVLWLITRTGNIAILLSIIADLLAGIPTIVKSIKEPESESYFTFAATSVGTIILLLTIKNWNFATYAFPVYLFILATVLAVLIKTKIGKRLNFI